MKYAIKTYGCKLNQAEAASLNAILNQEFEKSKESNADLVVLNSCGVIKKTERKVLKKAKELKNKGKIVIITGCLPAMIDIPENVTDLVINGNDFSQFKNRINEYFDLNISFNKSEIPTISKKGSVSTIIPIASGCLGSCAYCSIKFARKNLTSYPKEEIVRRVKRALNQGKKEIQITSQDLAVYGKERGDFELISLLKEIISINKKFRVKLGMMNIRFLKEFFNEFLPLFTSEKLYNFLHIPIQSGSNKILSDMNRGHKVSDFVEIVEKIRNYDDFLIATDVIVGFPTEKKQDYQKTVDLLKEKDLDIVNITRYSERKNTEAAKLKDMPSRIKKKRSRKLAKLTKEQRLDKNRREVGKIYNGLLIRKGKNNTIMSRIKTGKVVILPNGKLGAFKRVNITDFKHNYLIGKMC